MTKKTTVRFYTANGCYSEWKYLTETSYFDIIRWTEQGNYLLVKDQRIDSKTKSSIIFALLRKKK